MADFDVDVICRWQKEHRPSDFVYLYEAFKNLIEKAIHRYPVEIHQQLTIPAIGIFVQALSTFTVRESGLTPATHVFNWMTRLDRVAGKILYPNLPESRRPKNFTNPR